MYSRVAHNHPNSGQWTVDVPASEVHLDAFAEAELIGIALHTKRTHCLAAVFELATLVDESLLVWRDAKLLLDLGFDVVDRVAGLDCDHGATTEPRN